MVVCDFPGFDTSLSAVLPGDVIVMWYDGNLVMRTKAS